MLQTLIEKGKEFFYIFTHGLSGTFLAIFSVLLLTGWWMLYVKAGEQGWKIFIPFYRTYLLFKIAEGKGIKFLLLYVPLLNIYYYFRVHIRLALAFGKRKKYGLGMVLLPWLFVVMLGFGDAEYSAPAKEN